MKVTVCIGSSCHIKGSRQVVETLQELVKNHQRSDIELAGAFCMENCMHGVSVSVDGVCHSVKPEEAAAFFATQLMPSEENQ